MDTMMDRCEYAVSVGEQQGADEVEAFWTQKVSTAVKAALGEISTAMTTRNEGMRIRVVTNNALGSAFTYRLDKGSIQKTVSKALAASRVSKKDEYWESFPGHQNYSTIDVWDSTMEEVRPEDLTAPVIEILQAVPDPIIVHYAAHEIILHQQACVNSNGVEHEEKGTRENIALRAVGKLGDGVTPSFYKASFSRKYDPAPAPLVEDLIHKITLFKQPDAAVSGPSHVLFSPFALFKLFYYTLFKAVSGENVARGKSLLAGKEETKVASSIFTLHDNGIVPQGIASAEMDDEGVPCEDTPLVEKGILKGVIWDHYWATRMGETSTGNAHYSDQTGTMSIQQTNMVVHPGKYSTEELYSIDRGYYVLDVQGAHGSNPDSGNFSVMCAPALRIRKGELSGGVTGMMLSDNIFSLLQNIDAVGRESEVREVAILPPVRVTNINVVAK
ncbi:MAG: hypothetical protein AYK18_04770 [Theionarchaea archaeon DG-70]|nr:MAG: hypothetical protein AYK18_04770 [Theionarchaea archaeon DG-70]